MPIDQEARLSENDLHDVALLVVEECEAAFSSLGQSLKSKLSGYPDDLYYRALAIGLIYMLASHLRHHAALTSVEESVQIAMDYLETHIRSDLSEMKIKSEQVN